MPTEFYISIMDTDPSQSRYIHAISIKMDGKKTRDAFFALVKSVQGQLVSDINAGKVGSPAYNNVMSKVQELAAILPNAVVTMELNFEYYGVNVTNDEDIAGPTPIEEPTLVINMVNDKNCVDVDILPNEFNTRLYTFLVEKERLEEKKQFLLKRFRTEYPTLTYDEVKHIDPEIIEELETMIKKLSK